MNFKIALLTLICFISLKKTSGQNVISSDVMVIAGCPRAGRLLEGTVSNPQTTDIRSNGFCTYGSRFISPSVVLLTNPKRFAKDTGECLISGDITSGRFQSTQDLLPISVCSGFNAITSQPKILLEVVDNVTIKFTPTITETRNLSASFCAKSAKIISGYVETANPSVIIDAQNGICPSGQYFLSKGTIEFSSKTYINADKCIPGSSASFIKFELNGQLYPLGTQIDSNTLCSRENPSILVIDAGSVVLNPNSLPAINPDGQIVFSTTVLEIASCVQSGRLLEGTVVNPVTTDIQPDGLCPAGSLFASPEVIFQTDPVRFAGENGACLIQGSVTTGRVQSSSGLSQACANTRRVKRNTVVSVILEPGVVLESVDNDQIPFVANVTPSVGLENSFCAKSARVISGFIRQENPSVITDAQNEKCPAGQYFVNSGVVEITSGRLFNSSKCIPGSSSSVIKFELDGVLYPLDTFIDSSTFCGRNNTSILVIDAGSVILNSNSIPISPTPTPTVNVPITKTSVEYPYYYEYKRPINFPKSSFYQRRFYHRMQRPVDHRGRRNKFRFDNKAKQYVDQLIKSKLQNKKIGF